MFSFIPDNFSTANVCHRVERLFVGEGIAEAAIINASRAFAKVSLEFSVLQKGLKSFR